MNKQRRIVVIVLAVLAVLFLTAGLLILLKPNKQNLQVAFLSVGQGDAILIRTPDAHNILIDGGPDQTILTRLGAVLPWYDRQLDLIILTHNHDDHLQGLLAVLKKYQVDAFLTGKLASPLPKDLAEGLASHQVAYREMNAGEGLELANNVHIRALWPNSGQPIIDINDRSLVLELTYGERKFLLAGDAGVEVEAELLKRNLVDDVDVFKLSHHASDTANSQEFLDKIKPEYGVVEVGIDNRLGHPNRRILKRLERVGAKVLRTDWDGSVVFSTDGRELSYRVIK